jgi:LPS export ABC transporter permease LptG/LPS export ABC transporter permease LptF
MSNPAGFPPPVVPGRTRRIVPPCRIDLYLFRGLIGPFLAALLLAGMAMMLERALRLAEDLAASGADFGYFLPLLGLLTPYYVGLALPAALMIALVFLIARLDETLELEAMLASGLTLARIAMPLIAFALLVAGMAVAANGFLEPLGRHAFRMMRAEAQLAATIGTLQPVSFYRPSEDLTFSFDATTSQPGRIAGVFVRQGLDSGEAVLTARHAALALSADRRAIQLSLEDGFSYHDADPGLDRKAFALAFDSYEVNARLPRSGFGRARGSDQKELTLAELIDEGAKGRRRLPRAAVAAELYSRLARSISIVLLPLLAIPLAFAAKKTRRSFGIVMGGALLMAFHHGVNFVKNVSRDGDPDPAAGFAILCGAFTLFVLALFVSSRSLPSHSPVTDLLGRLRLGSYRPGLSRARLLPLPGGTIGAYVAGGLALWTLAAVATVLLLLQMVDLIERSDDFAARQLGPSDVAHYMLLRLPILFQQTIGIAALAGAMFALLRLTRFSEMVAIRAAGVSLPRLLLMLLPVAASLSVLSLLLAEYAVPARHIELASWWRGNAFAPAPPEARWFRIGGDIVRIDDASATGREIHGLSVYRRSPDGLLIERFSAAAAKARPGGWALREVSSVRMDGGKAVPTHAASRIWRTDLDEADLRALIASPPRVSSRAARRALAGVAPVDEGPPRFETRLQRRFAEPLVPIVMLLLALPLALASSRQGPSWPLLLYPVLAGIAFLVSDGVLTLAAEAGMVAPWIGAWTAPICFALIGATVLVYAEA